MRNYNSPRERQRVQAMQRKTWIAENRTALLGLAVFMAIWAGVSTADFKLLQIADATQTCNNQTAYTTPTFDQCVSNQFENNSDK